MIDPITIAIGAASATALSGGAAIANAAKSSKMEKELKKQRMEMYVLEGAVAVASTATWLESAIWRRRATTRHRMMEREIASAEERFNALNARLNAIEGLKSSIDSQNSKLDEISKALNSK